MTPILRLEDVNGYYKRTIQVLNHISMEVQQGGITCVLGANGSGKTTLFRAICGIIDVTGAIKFQGNRIDGRATETIANLGICHVPQGRGTFADLTVEENFRVAGHRRFSRNEFNKMLDEMFDMFPALKDYRKVEAGNLSGGEQQMIAIGRALMTRPRLLLLDEPSIGLAPKITKQIFNTLLRINREGDVAILLNEQNVELATSISNSVYLLETGRIVFSGTPELLASDDSVRKAYLG